jgi:sRNA-binding protein
VKGLIGRIRWWLGLRPAAARVPWPSRVAHDLAERHAANDRATLARLRANNAVELRRQDVGDGQRQQAKPFIRDIEARALGERNLALRPKRKRGKR